MMSDRMLCVGEKTNLVHANKSDSLRTTVPSSIVKQFDLGVGDQIEWNIVACDNKIGLKVNIHKQQIDKSD